MFFHAVTKRQRSSKNEQKGFSRHCDDWDLRCCGAGAFADVCLHKRHFPVAGHSVIHWKHFGQDAGWNLLQNSSEDMDVQQDQSGRVLV